MVDIARDPRWGRIVESSGEDPYLGAAIARAWVKGYQQGDLSWPDSVGAEDLHNLGWRQFAGHGQDRPEGKRVDRQQKTVVLAKWGHCLFPFQEHSNNFGRPGVRLYSLAEIPLRPALLAVYIA